MYCGSLCVLLSSLRQDRDTLLPHMWPCYIHFYHCTPVSINFCHLGQYRVFFRAFLYFIGVPCLPNTQTCCKQWGYYYYNYYFSNCQTFKNRVSEGERGKNSSVTGHADPERQATTHTKVWSAYRPVIVSKAVYFFLTMKKKTMCSKLEHLSYVHFQIYKLTRQIWFAQSLTMITDQVLYEA